MLLRARLNAISKAISVAEAEPSDCGRTSLPCASDMNFKPWSKIYLGQFPRDVSCHTKKSLGTNVYERSGLECVYCVHDQVASRSATDIGLACSSQASCSVYA